MSQQPAEEWSEMSQQQRDEIRARLIAACDTRADAAPTLRQHLANGSRSALAARLAQTPATLRG